MEIRQLHEKLNKILNENTRDLSLEDCKAIFADTYKFSDFAEEINDFIQDGEKIEVKHDSIRKIPSIKVTTEPFVHIITYEDFKELVNELALEYKSEKINDFLEPYFNLDQYYKDAIQDSSLTDFLLEEQADITNYDYATLNGTDYVVIEE